MYVKSSLSLRLWMVLWMVNHHVVVGEKLTYEKGVMIALPTLLFCIFVDSSS